jgi:hypothetical protein
MEVPVFNVHTQGQSHVGCIRQLALALAPWTTEFKHRGVVLWDHPRLKNDVTVPAITGMGGKMPSGGRTGFEADEVVSVQRRNEPVRIQPGAEPLREHMSIHGEIRMKVGAKKTVILGLHLTQVHADSSHAATAVRQQDQTLFDIRRTGLRPRIFSREKEEVRVKPNDVIADATQLKMA